MVYVGESRGDRKRLRSFLAKRYGVPVSHVHFHQCYESEVDSEIRRAMLYANATPVSWRDIGDDYQERYG